MYDEDDLEAAVAAGAIRREAADALRSFVAHAHAIPAADVEHFRFVAGFSDLFAASGLILLLVAILFASAALGPLAGAPLLIAGWLLSRAFARRGRPGLPAIILFLGYALGAAMCAALASAVLVGFRVMPSTAGVTPQLAILTGLGTALACWLYWHRFELPIAYAGVVLALVNVAVNLVRAVYPAPPSWFVALLLLAVGIALFVHAMWWDLSDVYRQTRRADVAFWLHAMAGFQIAGATFRLVIGVRDPYQGWDRLYSFAVGLPTAATALATILLFVAFTVVALAIDRRSIIASSTAYAVLATGSLIGGMGDAGMPTFFLTLGLVGSLLVTLSLRWQELRRTVLARLPVVVRAQLPRTSLEFLGPRPIA